MPNAVPQDTHDGARSWFGALQDGQDFTTLRVYYSASDDSA